MFLKKLGDILLDKGISNIEISVRELGVDEPSSPLIEAVLETWRSWCGSEAMPPWHHVDLMELPLQLVPLTIVLDVTRHPREYIYRFWGTRLTAIHSQEMTGRSVNEITPSELAEIARINYDEVVAREAPVRTINQYLGDDKKINDDFIIRLPISDNGKDVQKILCVIDSDAKHSGILDSISSNFSLNP